MLQYILVEVEVKASVINAKGAEGYSGIKAENTASVSVPGLRPPEMRPLKTRLPTACFLTARQEKQSEIFLLTEM